MPANFERTSVSSAVRSAAVRPSLIPSAGTDARPLRDPGTAAISLRDVGKRFWMEAGKASTLQDKLLSMARGATTPYWALQGISFDLWPGDSVGILGANGAGKSTLMRLICGVGRPTTGEIRVRGRVTALLELGAGMSAWLTGRENLYVNAVVSGLRRAQVDAIYNDIVDFAELGDFIDEPIRTYSAGMRMRLAFSIAIHVDPAVLVVDEVLAVGDAHFAAKCRERIDEFRHAGKTMLIASHSMDVIRSLCSRAIVLQKGTLVADGPAAEIAARYTSVIAAESLTGKREAQQQAK